MNNCFQVELSEAQALCQYIPEISFVMETSAKENTNIKDIFYLLATELMVSELTFKICYKHIGSIVYVNFCSEGSQI